MKRRSFLKQAGLGAIAGGATLATPVFAQNAPSIDWRMASSFPRTLDTLFGAGEIFCDYVRQATNGKFDISALPAGDAAPGLQVMAAVSENKVQCGHTSSLYYYEQDPAFCFDAAVPFGLNARQMNAWMLEGDGLTLTRDMFAAHHIVNFPMGNTGVQMGGWFRKELKSLADLTGLKMRTAGLGGAVLARLGVEPQQLEAAEIAKALEKGGLDAAEFVGPHDDEKLGLNKAATFYYSPGWWEGGAQASLYVNADEWEKLPKHYQTIVEAASRLAHVALTARYDALNPAALRRLVAGGAELRMFPRSVMDASYDAAQQVCLELAQQNPRFKTLHDSYMGFRDSVVPWFRVAENPYDQYVGVTLGARR